MSWIRTLLAWILYLIGDGVSRVGQHWDSALIWFIYQKVMVWSVLLDREGRIWKEPAQDPLDK